MTAPLYMRRRDASAYLTEKYGQRCTYSTLAKLAVVGGGPLYRKAGPTPLYTAEDLDSWAESRIGKPQRSTSDVGTPNVPPERAHALSESATFRAEMSSPANDTSKSSTADKGGSHER